MLSCLSVLEQYCLQVACLVNYIVPVTISVLIVNDLSALQLSKIQKRATFAGLKRAAKRVIATRWKPPHDL